MQHRFRFTNLYISDTLKQTRLSVGEDFQDDDSEFEQDTAFFERQLIDSQLVAEMKFGDLDLDLRAGYAQTDREAPFEYNFTYVRTNNANDPLGDRFINVLDRQTGTASVAFSDLTEKLYYGGFDIAHPVTDWFSLAAGYAYTDTDRRSIRREFLFDAGTQFEDAVGSLRPDLLLGDAVIDFFDIGLIETTQADPAFDADLEIQAGYVKAQIEPAFGVSVDVGVRYEDATQTVVPVEGVRRADQFGQRHVPGQRLFPARRNRYMGSGRFSAIACRRIHDDCPPTIPGIDLSDSISIPKPTANSTAIRFWSTAN